MLGLNININKNRRYRMFSLDSYKSDLQFVFSDYQLIHGTFKIEIREDDGGTTAEFNYVNGYIDKVSIQAFVGANSGYVSAMWDQKTGEKVSIDNESQQRQIINAGTWVDYTAKYNLEIPQNTALTVSGIAAANRMKNLNACSYIGFNGSVAVSGYTADYVFPINCSAGLMDFGWTNLSGIFWYLFGGGTSTNARPGATLGAGISYSFGTNMLANNILLSDNNTNERFIGNLADLPRIVYYLSITGCVNAEGDIKDAPRVTYVLGMENCAKIIGNIINVPKAAWILNINSVSLLEGLYSDFVLSQNQITVRNITNATGILSVTPTANYIELYNNNQSSSDTDNTIINIANTVTALNGTLKHKNNRTPASNEAVAILVAKGWTLTPS